MPGLRLKPGRFRALRLIPIRRCCSSRRNFRRAARLASRLAGDERGAVAVEFAVIFTFVLLPLIIGIIQFGLVFAVQSAMENAAQAGARRAAIVDQDASRNPVAEGKDAIQRSLGPWWDLFFTDKNIDKIECVEKGQSEWRVNIRVEIQTVAIVDPFGVLGSGEMTSSSVWPVEGGCSGAGGGAGGEEDGENNNQGNGGDDGGNPGRGNGPPPGKGPP